ncbi:MAG: lipase family alpha/beta hydrolase, partial [Caldilineaceae bacterium]
TPLYLRYNSGVHISTNGRDLASLLETTVAQWPVPVQEIVLVGHSMGGLVARSACHYGAIENHAWLGNLRKLVMLGAPHHGSPWERIGAWTGDLFNVSGYSAPFGRLGRLRSAGITDLRHGNIVDEDWSDGDRFVRGPDRRKVVPLPADVATFAAAATRGATDRDPLGRLLGDGLVPISSALGHHSDSQRTLAIPRAHQWVGYGMTHLDLLNRPEVYAKLQEWVAS